MKKIILMIVIGVFILSGCTGISPTGPQGLEGGSSDAGEYNMETMDAMLRECNTACCGEETPASCTDECRWPGYVDCFHGCMDKHPEDTYNCDADCWPKHKEYFENKIKECS